MPTPPRRLGDAGRRLWTSVHRRYRLTLEEGVLLAAACDLTDTIARLEADQHCAVPSNEAELVLTRRTAAWLLSGLTPLTGRSLEEAIRVATQPLAASGPVVSPPSLGHRRSALVR